MSNPSLNLTDFTFAELFHSEGLYRLDQQFLNTLDPHLGKRLMAYRDETAPLTPVEISDLLIECARPLEDFLVNLFDIEEATALAAAKTLSHNPVSAFKKFFVLRRAKKNSLKSDQLPSFVELTTWL